MQVIHSLRKGGAERLCLQLSKRCLDAGNEVHILTLENKVEYPQFLSEGIAYASVLENVHWRKDFFNLVFKTRRIISSLTPDIIHTHLPTASIIVYLASRMTYVQTLHNTNYWFWNSKVVNDRLMRSGEKRSVCTARCTPVAVSEDVAEAYTNQYLLANVKRVRIIENGIDLNEFSGPSFPRKARNGVFKIIMVGTLNKTKNHQLAVHAFSELKNKIPEAELFILGDGPCMDELALQVKSLGLIDRVQLLGQRSDVVQLLSEADLFWHTSLHEGLPLVIVEAMAMGLPVVAGDIPGLRGLCINNKNCVLVPSNEIRPLVEETLHLFTNGTLRDSLSEAAPLHVRKYFDINRMANRYLGLYSEIVAHDAVNQ